MTMWFKLQPMPTTQRAYSTRTLERPHARTVHRGW